MTAPCRSRCRRKLEARPCSGEITTPTVSSSTLPGLLGLAALKKNRAVLDFQKLELHFLGPGDYELERHLPPGSETYVLHEAPSGHLMLPCSEYSREKENADYSLTLVTQENDIKVRFPQNVPPPPAEPPIMTQLDLQETTPPGLDQY